jgi:membrane protease subunit (stomatin/prohibitin family)
MQTRYAVAMLALVFGGAAQANPIYYNVFNFEDESDEGAAFVTYDSLEDMLLDQNRVDSFFPDGPFTSENNIIGSGSDGTTFWNLFNFEEESDEGAAFVTYDSIEDMLLDQNRVDSFFPDGPFTSENNIVGTGSDGESYWNVFNFEEESDEGAAFVIYDTLIDMLLDQNRVDSFFPDGPFTSENNIIGSGATLVGMGGGPGGGGPGPGPVPEPGTFALLLVGLLFPASRRLARIIGVRE